MVTAPTFHSALTTIGQLRAFFADEHVHMALLVDGHELIGTVERADLGPELGDRQPARMVAALEGRTIGAEDPLADAFEAMRSAGHRRLAVTAQGSSVVGLLCLKASGDGFCSDVDVAARRGAAPTVARS